MLQDERAAGDADDFPIQEKPLQDIQGGLILGQLVGRYQDSAVNNQEICVGRRQALAFRSVASVRPGQGR